MYDSGLNNNLNLHKFLYKSENKQNFYYIMAYFIIA